MRWVWTFALLAALPALVAAAASVGATWTPGADHAPIEVRVRDVSSANPPLVGVYSRVGGNHPGPAMFYLLAGPYRLLGSQPWALLVGAAVFNAAMIALSVRIAGRRGRAGVAAATAALILSATWLLGVDFLRDPWNPHIALFPFLLAALATWGVATGSRRCLPVAAVAASFCLQAHVGYLLLAGMLGVWCLVGLWWHRSHLRQWRAAGAITLVALVLLWAPVLGQQAFGASGNLTQIVSNAGDTGDAKFGIEGMKYILLPHLGPTPVSVRPTPYGPFELGAPFGLWPPPLGLLAIGAGAVVATRRRSRDQLMLIALTTTLWVAGAISMTQVSGIPAAYLFRWIRALVILLWLAALWPLATEGLRLLAHRVPRPRAAIAPAVAVVALAALAVPLAIERAGAPFAETNDQEERMALLVDEALRTATEAVPVGSSIEVRTGGGVIFLAPAVVAALERSGFDVYTGSDEGTVWGRQRLPGTATPDLVLVVTGEEPRAAVEAGRAARLAGTVDMLSPDERQEYEATGPPPERCGALLLAAMIGEDAQAAEAEVEDCARRASLAERDRRISVLIG
ncbi:hypothetical protein BH23ACT2_BH23ACT2_26800 [soil metagenome]